MLLYSSGAASGLLKSPPCAEVPVAAAAGFSGPVGATIEAVPVLPVVVGRPGVAAEGLGTAPVVWADAGRPPRSPRPHRMRAPTFFRDIPFTDHSFSET